ncbi:hypothetical protein OHA19_24210 [Streptomyces sp. NBC_00012]|uniref:hypothetical protein n=1 Tax=unclassified Streptomyces TaxID=2593676 RepID=UPI003245DF75
MHAARTADGLRSGDVFVPGSRRYDNPAAHLFKPAPWETHRTEFCRLVGKSSGASQALPLVIDELDEASEPAYGGGLCALHVDLDQPGGGEFGVREGLGQRIPGARFR